MAHSLQKSFLSARRLLPANILERWPQVCRIKITFSTVYITIDELFRFHNNKLDEMPCKLDSTENTRSFEKYPTY